MADIKEPLDKITEAMQDVELGSLAHSWHCNIAMACYDAIREAADGVPHEQAHLIGNYAASRFMKMLFDVETKNN